MTLCGKYDMMKKTDYAKSAILARKQQSDRRKAETIWQKQKRPADRARWNESEIFFKMTGLPLRRQAS